MNSGGGNKKKTTQEGKDYKDMKDKAHAASLKLASAAKEAETNIKYVLINKGNIWGKKHSVFGANLR